MTDYVVEPEKRVPVAREVDVAVVGAGCPGVFAAMAAAKEGARAILIDRFGIMGGNVGPGMIYGCVDPFAEGPLHMPGGNKGLVKQAEERVRTLMASRPEARPVYSALFGTGFLLFGSFALGLASLAVAALAMAGIFRVLPRVGI